MNKQSYTVEKSFMDGNLGPFFREEGYQAPEWKAGKVRTISQELALKVKQSGGLLTVPEPGAPEDVYISLDTPPVITPPDELIEQYRQQFAKEIKIHCIATAGFTDGDLRLQFAALDRPPTIGKYEIVDLPETLVLICRQRGAELSGDIGMLEEHRDRQVTHRLELEAWRKSHREELARRDAIRQAERDAAEEERRKEAKRAKLGI